MNAQQMLERLCSDVFDYAALTGTDPLECFNEALMDWLYCVAQSRVEFLLQKSEQSAPAARLSLVGKDWIQ